MTGEAGDEQGSGWKKFLRNHRAVVPIFAVAVILVFVGAIRVFIWFAADAQSSGLVPGTLELWTVGYVVTFILHMILWELLLVGVPVLIAAIAFWLWLKGLPDEERRMFRSFRRRRRMSRRRGGLSALFFLAFCVKVYIDGNWNVPIGKWTFDYLVSSLVTIWILGLIILGIPAVIWTVWWIRRELRKEP